MSPYRDAAHLQALLDRVLRQGYAAPEAGLILRQRLAVAFVLTAPELRARVDGRDGQEAHVTFGEEAAGPADLTFQMDGSAAHAFWMGELNPVAAMSSGRMRIGGGLLRALALAPGLPHLQRAYREAYAADPGEAGPFSETVR
ncbi:hypothetical protein [Deinococcus aestuarii]|uniref:hypothetical protein n=1 Tax=Deinococcus aestuarii TaxID=2774531 RepID=UPI001C0AACE1|nr:hypothetical protein [Deinococcus aestuarii]